MNQQSKLRLGSEGVLRALWDRFTDEQRRQVIALYAQMIERAVRSLETKEKCK